MQSQDHRELIANRKSLHGVVGRLLIRAPTSLRASPAARIGRIYTISTRAHRAMTLAWLLLAPIRQALRASPDGGDRHGWAAGVRSPGINPLPEGESRRQRRCATGRRSRSTTGVCEVLAHTTAGRDADITARALPDGGAGGGHSRAGSPRSRSRARPVARHCLRVRLVLGADVTIVTIVTRSLCA